MTFKYSEIIDKPLKFSEISGDPPPRVTEVSPEEEEVQIGNIVDWSDMYEENALTIQQLYEPVSKLIKSIPDPVDVNSQPVEVELPTTIGAAKGEEGKEKGIANTLLGFKYPPKPPDWEFASPIEKFNFITLPISDYLGRVGGKIATDWRMMKKEDVQKQLVSELSDDLKWYQKSPEAVGWTAEKVAEFIAIKGVFKASGLHKALTAAGQKVASPFIAAEITAAGGMKTISTWSAAGIKGLIRKGMTSFLTAAPENTAFISSWSALDAIMKGEPVGEAAVSGAGWGLALTAGLSVIGPVTQVPELRLAFKKAIANVGKRFPGMLDKLGKPVTEEVQKEWLKVISRSRGKDIRLIDLAIRERQMFRNAIRAAEKEILKAAEREAAISTYWATQAAKKAAKPKFFQKKVETGIQARAGEATQKGRPTIIVPDKGLLVYEETAEGLRLQNIDVVEGERRKGIGTAMVRKAEEITGKKFTDFTEVASPEGKAFIEKVIEKPPEGIEPVVAGFDTETVPLSKKEDAKVAGAAFLLDDGSVIKGADTHFGLVNKVPEGRKVVDSGFVDEQGNYLNRDDVIKGVTPQKAEALKVEAAIDKTTIETDEIVVDDKQLKPLVGETMPKGIVDISNVGAIKEAYNKAHDWMLTFGQAKREDPELYNQLMKAYGKRNAGIEKALDQVDKILPKEIKIDDDVNMAIVYEDKRLSIDPKQEETYDKFKTLLDEMSAKQQEEGLFAKPFNERMIEENNIRLQKEKLTPEQISKILDENKVLKEMRYLPHSIVVKRVIESKVNTLSGDKKKAYLNRLSAFYKKRKGKLFLKDYLDSGLITKDDMRMSRLAIEEVADYYIRSAYKGLYDYGKEKGYIQPFSETLRGEGWLTREELGITSPELKKQLVHPLFGSSLAEMKAMRQGRGSLANQIFGMVKQGQFIKPTIVWIYDGVQHYMRGMFSFNPVTEAKVLSRATRSVLDKDELYHKLNESNLFQFPYEISKGARDEEIAKFINQHSAELDRVTKILEKATDTRWFDPDMTLGKMVKNIAMAAHRGMGQLTWTGDKMQRTQSYLILRKMGETHDNAVKIAANSHGGYSLLSDSYKKFMTKKTFVYSFRFLMPLEMGKTIIEPIIAAKDAMGGKKIPKAHWERMVKAVIATAVIPIATDEYMKWRGFKKEGKHLGPLAWKWSKEVTVDGERREIVVGMNNILNMPVKYWNRITKYNPVDSSNRGVQVLKNLAKWEVHPIYRIFGWDVMDNRRSFGSGMNVYDTEASTVVQIAQISKYVIGQSIRFFGQTMDAVGEGDMTDKERVEQEKIYESALNDFDKVLFWALGYKYIRQPLRERQAIMMKALQKELTTRAFQYARKYEGEELEKRKEGLERWAEKSEKWIKEGMK